MSTILYVDDEVPIQRAIRSLLARRGHTVLTAGSISAARAVLETTRVDGVFIDIWLGMDSGFDLFEWIDMHKPELVPRVAFVTGDIDLEPRTREALGAYERTVVIKPFEMSELERIINDWSTI